VLEIPNLIIIHTVLDLYPQIKKSIGIRSGLLGGQKIGLLLPIQALGNFSFYAPCTGRLNLAGAPSCMKMTQFPVSLSKSSICGKT
jgi:hypothetical protein